MDAVNHSLKVNQSGDTAASQIVKSTKTAQVFDTKAQAVPGSDSSKASAGQARLIIRNNDNDRNGLRYVEGLGTVQMTPEKWDAFQKKLELAVFFHLAS